MKTKINIQSRIAKLSAILSILLACWLFVKETQAQDTQYSQFYASPLYLSPSFAGGSDGSRLVLNYRNQWPEIPGAFVTYSMGIDHYFHNYNSGVGLLLFRDQAGSGNLALTSANLLYSYNLQLNHEWFFRPGISFSYSQRTVDWEKQIFGDQLSFNVIAPTTLTPIPIDKVQYFDASVSGLAFSETLWFGLTVDHLMTPNQSFTAGESSVPMKFSVFGGKKFPFGFSLGKLHEESISISYLYKHQDKFNQFDLGVYWSKLPVSVGLLYRGIPIFNNSKNGYFNNDALVLVAGLKTDYISFGYSYDFTVSRLSTSTGGSHEISLIFLFNQGPPTKKQGKIPCPDF